MIFDFDGVVVDSEPIHFDAFARVLAERGIVLAERDYYSTYLGYDDHDCFMHILQDNGKAADEPAIAEMTAVKTRLVQQAMGKSIPAQPGAVELIRAARAAGIPLAICSGALREEIELASRTVGVWDCFMDVVSAKDVDHGKPDPQGYRMALEHLRRVTGRELRASATLVVEDAPAGITAARGAGMKVLAVTTSYDRADLHEADLIVDSLAEATIAALERITRA